MVQSHLMKLQQMQNNVFRTIGKFTRNTPIRDKHNAFQISKYAII
jgi:hypothetical protein